MIDINPGTKSVRAGACLLTAALTLIAPLSGLQENEPAAPDTVPTTEFPPGVETLDRIVAVVGDTAILMSDLQITLYQLQGAGARVPPEGSELWKAFADDVLEAMIDDLIYLQEAKNAGITVPEGRVTQMSDEIFAERRSRFSSDDEMMLAVEETGMNMLQFRQMLRSQAHAEGLRQAYRYELEQRTDLPPVIVSEEEVEAAFEEFAQNQPPRPALVSFNRLVVTPLPSGEARDSVLARTIRVQNDFANDEEEFSVLARRHSDDEGTREQGGELGWMSRDLLVKPFGEGRSRDPGHDSS